MKLVMTLLVRDEADILRSTLDYHLSSGIDLMLVTDNGSVDGTERIVQEFVSTGRVKLFHQPPSDFSQGVWVTGMARLAATEYDADWVIHGDADEFFIPAPTSSHSSLPEILSSIPVTVDKLLIQRDDFVPVPMSDGTSPPEQMMYRKTLSRNLKGDPLPPKIIHRGAADVTVSQGNHLVQSQILRGEARECLDLRVYHYPIRTFRQFEMKVQNGGSGYEKNTVLPPTAGHHKRHWYRLYQEGRLREEFDRLFYSESRLQMALQAGELVEDRCLSDRLQAG